MAMQQAEQQFAAARMIGPESRPLNLFYGLSQAGRAVAIAAEASRRTATTPLSGHGLGCVNLSELAADPVEGFPVLGIRSHGQPNSSFVRLSELLSSEPLKESTSLGTLWGMLVEPQLHEPLTYPPHPVLLAESDSRSPDKSTVILALSGVPVDVALEDPKRFAKFRDGYPGLRGSQLVRVSGSSAARGRIRATASIELSRTGTAPQAWLSQASTDYRRSFVVLPSPGPLSHQVMHPLMVWWALLFSLSMLARYEPRSWTQLIDVNKSRHAVPIEYRLDVAAEPVPDLLADTLEALLDPTIG